MITTKFKIDLIEDAMGRYVFTSQSSTPTTMRTMTTWTSNVTMEAAYPSVKGTKPTERSGMAWPPEPSNGG